MAYTAPPSPTPKDPRGEYQRLADEAAQFERQTTLMLRERTEADKKWIADRKSAKAELMGRKLAASVAMNETEEAAEASRKQAEKDAAEAAAKVPDEPAPAKPQKHAAPPRHVAKMETNTTDREFEKPPHERK